jgi:putative ABC transport system substrate-binding protein
VLASPPRANAEQRPAQIIGLLHSASPGPFARLLDAFRQSLSDDGFVEGRNLTIEYRWAEGQASRLPELAADLVRRKVVLIVAIGGSVSARAARAATSTIPILFIGGPDPIADGLVKSLSSPGGNVTGLAVYTSELMPKRVQLLYQLVPQAKAVALLVNPTGKAADTEVEGSKTATSQFGQKLVVFEASEDRDFELAFVSAKQQGVGSLLVSANAFFTDRRVRLIELAARYRMPTAYPWRNYVDAGGLISYGPNIAEVYKQLGNYASRVLKGERPSDLPVRMPDKLELVINMKTLEALGLTLERSMEVLADEVIK